MVVQHFIAVLLVSVCAATRIQFPEKNACILIDFETNNSLSWTRENGTEMAIPNWDISNFSVPEGNCTGTPYLVIKFRVDNATLRFDFHNASGKVDLRMTLKFEPDVVFAAFNNTDQTPVEIKSALAAGSTEKAFKCNSEQKAPGKKMVGKDEYKITYRITNLKTQGYGVENGTYSKDTEECSEDNPTTAPPNTTVTTAPPNTTVTTAPPNTTVTTAPPNTTVTTAPPNTTVTTAPPNTTVTTHPPTTTTQPPNAPKVTLYATDGNNTCAMMQGAFTFKIPYNTTTKTEGSTATVEIPKDVNSTGNCMNQNKTDVLMARFGDGWEMDFVFKGDGTYIWLDQLNMTVVYDKAFFPDIDGNKTGTKATFNKSFSQLFKAKKDGSYLCNSDTTTELTNGITMMTKNFQYTALGNNVTKFSDKDVAECSADAKTSSIVPIAVGAALAGLVVIVLIAYLIGRRRNRKGYESV